MKTQFIEWIERIKRRKEDLPDNAEFDLRLDQETTHVSIVDGQVFFEGYDLESERIALTLRGGKGRGIGVLYVAIAEISPHDERFVAELKEFEQHLNDFKLKKPVLGLDPIAAPKSQIVNHYLSYSPEKIERDLAASFVKYSFWVIERLMRDDSIGVIETVAERGDLSNDQYGRLARHPEERIRFTIALNKRVPIDIWRNLSRDKVGLIREMIVRDSRCSVSTLLELSNDYDPAVLYAVFNNENFPRQEIEIIAKRGTKDQKLALGMVSYEDVLGLIDPRGDKDIEKAIQKRRERIAHLEREI